MIVLLVDSETVPPLGSTADPKLRGSHLKANDNWPICAADQPAVHFMAQCMETWFCASPDALERYFGQGFNTAKLPVRTNLEEEPKDDVLAKLAQAAEGSRKRRYHKIDDASRLLALVDPVAIASRCLHFKTFVDFVDRQI